MMKSADACDMLQLRQISFKYDSITWPSFVTLAVILICSELEPDFRTNHKIRPTPGHGNDVLQAVVGKESLDIFSL
jgi:hypothetical protein